MTVLTDNTLTKQTEISAFAYTKDNLASPVVSLFTFGSNIIESLSKNLGALNPVYASDPQRPGRINIIDKTRAAPELGEMPLRERVHRLTYNYLERKFNQDCDEMLLIKLDNCGQRDDLNSWQSIFLVDSLRLNGITVEALQSFDADAVVEMTGSFNLLGWDRIVPIKFGETADTEILAEALDVLYYDAKSCGTCSPYSEGCNKIAVLTAANSGSPGLSSQFVYTVNHGSTWTVADIASLGGRSGNRMTSVGSYFVVVSETDGAHHYAPKSNPSASSWIRVSTGYDPAGSPRCIFAKSTSEVFIGGAAGRIYKATNITAGVSEVADGSQTTQNANDIHGSGQTIVSVHNNNVILLSINNGVSFALVTGPTPGVALTAVQVLSQYQWYVGTANGKLYYTTDQGVTWTQRLLPNQSTLTSILDIQFSPESSEVGAIAVQATSVGYVYRTLTGGREWYSDSPGISNLPTNNRINAVALCGFNEIAAVGRETAGGDGIVAIAG